MNRFAQVKFLEPKDAALLGLLVQERKDRRLAVFQKLSSNAKALGTALIGTPPTSRNSNKTKSKGVAMLLEWSKGPNKS